MLAASFCLIPCICRARFRCSPNVCGFLTSALGRGHRRRILVYGSNPKPYRGKATQVCRCGHLADASQACSRAPRCAADYQGRLSGPLLDRIDLHVDVAAVSAADLTLPPPAEGSAEVAARVARARAVQTRRYQDHGIRTNAEADGEVLEAHAAPDSEGRALLEQAATAMRLSARGYTRVLRVARTIADLGGAAEVSRLHIAEALAYRRAAPMR